VLQTSVFPISEEAEVNLTLQQLAKALNGEIKGNEVLCPGPGHSAKDRSLSVALSGAREGFIVYSFAGDDPIKCRDYIRDKLGLPKPQRNGNGLSSTDDLAKLINDAVASQKKTEPKGKLVAQYDYKDRDGTLLYQVQRYEPKTFRQRRPNGKNWIWNLDGIKPIPYRWQELLQFPEATVFVTEGEKDADAVAALDLCATTAAAGKWTGDTIQALAGRHVLILEDNDDAGRKKAIAAAILLHPVAANVKVIRLPGLKEHGDVSDWLDSGGTKDKLIEICADAPDFELEERNQLETTASLIPPKINA
jgi:hypothetical protein